MEIIIILLFLFNQLVPLLEIVFTDELLLYLLYIKYNLNYYSRLIKTILKMIMNLLKSTDTNG